MTKEQKSLEFMEILKNPDKISKSESGFLEYWKNGKMYFRYDPKYRILLCSYKLIWSVFERNSSLNYQEIRNLIEVTINNTFNGMEMTAHWWLGLDTL